MLLDFPHSAIVIGLSLGSVWKGVNNTVLVSLLVLQKPLILPIPYDKRHLKNVKQQCETNITPFLNYYLIKLNIFHKM